MANPYHVEIVKQGGDAVHTWRQAHSQEKLDLCEADLQGINLSEINLRSANLRQANLGGSKLVRTDLQSADLTEAHLAQADLREALLNHTILCAATLQGANLQDASLERADLSGAQLSDTTLQGAHLGDATLTDACLKGAKLYEADVTRAKLTGVRGAVHAQRLESVRMPGGPAYYFETCVRAWPERYLDWERLRTLGRLPLFGASYTALILLPIVFYGLAFYNDKVELVRTWAAPVAARPDHPLHWIATLVTARLHPEPLPGSSLLLLVSTVLLAVGASLYTFFCPSRIKEFSRDQWCDQLGRSLLHYWPLAWKYRWLRCVCAACYTLGGVGVLGVIVAKVWRTAVFILRHAGFPWPWHGGI